MCVCLCVHICTYMYWVHRYMFVYLCGDVMYGTTYILMGMCVYMGTHEYICGICTYIHVCTFV